MLDGNLRALIIVLAIDSPNGSQTKPQLNFLTKFAVSSTSVTMTGFPVATYSANLVGKAIWVAQCLLLGIIRMSEEHSCLTISSRPSASISSTLPLEFGLIHFLKHSLLS